MIRGRWIPVLAASVVLAGCASMGGGAASPDDGSPPPAVAAASSAAPAPSPTEALCTTRSCIATNMDQALPGIVAKDEAVIRKAVCKASSVQVSNGVWTATCTVTESDGSVSEGYGNIVPASQQVTYDPQKIIKMPGS